MTSEAGSPDTQDRLVAVADVLGFSHRMKTVPPETVAHQHRKLLALRNELAVPYRDEPDPLVESLAFSDTMVWSVLLDRPGSGPAVRSLVQALGMVVLTGILEDSPVRVAIAQGPCVIDPGANVVVGQPFLDAHDLQAACQWIGIAVHGSASRTLADECEEHLVTNRMFPVPLKRPRPLSIHPLIDESDEELESNGGVPSLFELPVPFCSGSIDWPWMFNEPGAEGARGVRIAATTAAHRRDETLRAYRANPSDERLSHYAKWLNTVNYIDYCSVEPSLRPRLGAQP